MTDRYLYLDPTGIALQVFPTKPIVLPGGGNYPGSRNILGSPVQATLEARYDFSTTCHLTKPEWDKVKALSQGIEASGVGEVVIYFLWDTHTDKGVKSRRAVPALPVVTEGGYVTYYPVIQGFLEATGALIGGGLVPCYEVELTFTEGTILR